MAAGLGRLRMILRSAESWQRPRSSTESSQHRSRTHFACGRRGKGRQGQRSILHLSSALRPRSPCMTDIRRAYWAVLGQLWKPSDEKLLSITAWDIWALRSSSRDLDEETDVRACSFLCRWRSHSCHSRRLRCRRLTPITLYYLLFPAIKCSVPVEYLLFCIVNMWLLWHRSICFWRGVHNKRHHGEGCLCQKSYISSAGGHRRSGVLE